MSIEKKLEDYRKLKAILTEIKESEMALRLEIVDEIASNVTKGTHNFTEYEGFKVKVVTKLNYSIDESVLEELPLTDEERECIRWKPSLKMKEFNASDTPNLIEAIMTKDAAPTLTVELI